MLAQLKKQGQSGFVAEPRQVSGAATPLMQQYREIKARHQDAILFFRMGDFYEMFYDDAETASRVLGLTLTSRNNGGAAEVPLAGIPVKAAAEYLRRLVDRASRRDLRAGGRSEARQGPRQARSGRDDHAGRGVCRRPAGWRARQLRVRDRHRARHGARWRSRRRSALRRRTCPPASCGSPSSSAADAPAVLARLAPRELLMVRGTSDDDVRAGACALRIRRWSPSARRGSSTRDGRRRADAAVRCARPGWLRTRRGDGAAIGAAGALLRYLRELQPGGLPHLARPIVERPAA